MKDVLGKQLPTITEVTLLSSEELKACGAFIPTFPDEEPAYYYLRTAYEDNLIGLASGRWEEDPTEPDYEDCPPDGSMGTALRPILRLVSSALKDGTVLEAGDNVVIGKTTFTAVSDVILMADRAAWYDDDMDTYGYFDDETNDYEHSLAKEHVDAWFRTAVEPYL